MIINGKKLEFSISSKNDIKNFESALRVMQEKEKKIKSMDVMNISGIIDEFTGMFRDFFITATDVDVIEECDDMEKCKNFYFEFLGELKKQQETFLSPFSTSRIE